MNIGGGDVLSGVEVVPYLQPVPPRGTGLHRYVLSLYTHREAIDVDTVRTSENGSWWVLLYIYVGMHVIMIFIAIPHKFNCYLMLAVSCPLSALFTSYHTCNEYHYLMTIVCLLLL